MGIFSFCVILFLYLFQFAVDYLARILLVDTLHFKYTTYRFSPSQPNMGSVVYSAPEPEQVISPTETDVLTDLPNGNHFELRPTNHSPAFTFESQTDSGFETGSQVRLIRQGSSVTTSCMLTHNRERSGIALEQFAASMSKKIQKEAETQTQHAEWKVVASVLDRLFFVTYLVLIVLSLAFLFPWPMWMLHTQLHLHMHTRIHTQYFQGDDTRLNAFAEMW